MKHTPGPWEIKYETNVFGGDGEILVANTGGRKDNRLPDGGLAENCANALLIAAAPGLLAFAEFVVDFIVNKWSPGQPLPTDVAAAMDISGRAVIAQAKGTPPPQMET
jgi:hypothetical protein